MTPTDIYREGVEHVVARMREKDRAEIYATREREDGVDEVVRDVLRFGSFGFVLHADDGEPVVCGGAVPMWPGVWSVWMFATDRFDEISLSVHRFARRVFFPALDQAGWHRLECRSLGTHKVAHRWLEALGAYKESESLSYGRDGEAFFVYCWTKRQPETQSS